jgi:hypothetical protein
MVRNTTQGARRRRKNISAFVWLTMVDSATPSGHWLNGIEEVVHLGGQLILLFLSQSFPIFLHDRTDKILCGTIQGILSTYCPLLNDDTRPAYSNDSLYDPYVIEMQELSPNMLHE